MTHPLVTSAITGIGLSLFLAPGVWASPPVDEDLTQTPKGHVLPNPLAERQFNLRQTALEAQLKGKAFGKTHEVARGQFVELTREDEDLIWTVLAEFSNLPHNAIPEPDRTMDNTTYWVADFNRNHYMDLLFSEGTDVVSMRDYYLEQSSNRYTVDGDVTDWVSVPGIAESYDDDLPGGVWNLIEDAVSAWYQAQMDAGQSPSDIAEHLSRFDVWDRYDYNNNGNFDEPDGYIDHFQIVHAGMGEEAGGGALGSAAIWSHRWYARYNLAGLAGPAFNMAGGVEIPGTGLWIGDYTVEPENGGVGVFAHEFAHDLGLPDLYDTTNQAENGTGYWTLMSSGSWLSDGTTDIGTTPGHMGAWEKFQLGWLNYEVAYSGQFSDHTLSPAEYTARHGAQGLFVLLPDKEIATEIGTPYAGEYFYYSGAGNNLYQRMSVPIDLTGASTLTAQVNYDIENHWDYAYVTISYDGGATWSALDTNRSTTDNPNGQNLGYGITGTTSGTWQTLSADLTPFTGEALLEFRYITDASVVDLGMMIDNIQIDGGPIAGAEMNDGWSLEGFTVTTGTETSHYFNAYVAEYRIYSGYDSTLEVGPYNFGFLDSPDGYDWVERFPYQDGLLISYWDTSFTNNNVSAHPGGGLILPVDAHPEPLLRPNGLPWRSRIQTFDATFTLDDTDAITLHWNSLPTDYPSQPGVRVFNDVWDYWFASAPFNSVKVPKTGTEIHIVNTSALGNFMKVKVSPPY